MALAFEREAMLRINCEAVMWKITTRGFTLEEVLIMAAMNLLASAATAPKREKRVSQKLKGDQDLKVTGPKITERDLGHGVVQCNHCNCSQFHSARFESVKRHFGMLRAFLMLSEQ